MRECKKLNGRVRIEVRSLNKRMRMREGRRIKESRGILI